jgi:hypothetical protein
MIEQTYYPFGGDNVMLPTLSGNSSFISDENQNEESTSNWLGWLLLIGSLIGIGCLIYWWRSKWPSESLKANVITEKQQ